MLSLAVLSILWVLYYIQQNLRFQTMLQVFTCNWGLKTMESDVPKSDAPKICYRRLREVSAVGLWVGKFLYCFGKLVAHGSSKVDAKPLLLTTKTNANNAIEASKAAGRRKITNVGKRANFREKLCNLCCQGRETMQPVSRAMTYNQVLTKCLLLVFFGETGSGVKIVGTARRDVSREQRRTATRSLTLRHTPPSERLGQVVFCAVTWPESRNASCPHAIYDFGPSSWRRETQGP